VQPFWLSLAVLVAGTNFILNEAQARPGSSIVCNLPAQLPELQSVQLGFLQEDLNLLRSSFNFRFPAAWPILIQGYPAPVKNQFVSVLPENATCWTQFKSWSIATREITYTGSSWWRGTYWDLKLVVVAAYGELRSSKKIKGRWVEKRGKFLGYVTVVPELLSKGPRGRPIQRPDFFAEVKILGVYNQGTRFDPVATVDLLVSFSRKGERQSRMFQVRGDGFIELMDSSGLTLNRRIL
jgi:hypothetical protein